MNKRDSDAFLTYHHRTKILDKGWTQKDVYRGYYVAGLEQARQKESTMDDPGSIAYANEVIRLLLAMTDEVREHVFSEFCKDCGSKNPNCECWRNT